MKIEGELDYRSTAEVIYKKLMKNWVFKIARILLLLVSIWGLINLTIVLLVFTGVAGSEFLDACFVKPAIMGLGIICFLIFDKRILGFVIKRTVFKNKNKSKITYEITGDTLIRVCDEIKTEVKLNDLKEVVIDKVEMIIRTKTNFCFLIPKFFFDSEKVAIEFKNKLGFKQSTEGNMASCAS